MNLFSKKHPSTPTPSGDAAASEASTSAPSFDDVAHGYATSEIPDAPRPIDLGVEETAATESEATEAAPKHSAATGSAAEADMAMDDLATDDATAGPVAPTAVEDDVEDEAPTTGRRPHRVTFGVAAALALVLGGGAAAAVTAHKTVEVDVNGTTQIVTTFSGDVEGLLAEQAITVGQHDLVVPAADEALTEGADVVVRTAQQVSFAVDGRTSRFWTTATTAGEAVADLAGAGRDISLTASRSSDGRVQLELPLVTDGPVVLGVDGELRTVEVAGEADLEQSLAQARVELGAMDTVSVAAREDGTPVVTITRIGLEQTSRTEAIEQTASQRESDDLYVGQSRVVQEGADGVRTYVSSNRVVDGAVVASKLVRVDVTTEPVERIVEFGTAARPAPVVAPSTSSSSAGDSSGSSGAVSGDVWARLAQCESGGDPTAVSASGTYHGLYQFSVGTWQSVGGSGLPSQASAAEQTQRAQTLQARSGWGQWPSCARQLGLL
ncbi:MAG: transglycosylase family protein [Actinomycetales bacterium]|nr:transglycosylase family protein [Actinomycetales bacterium]